MAPLAGSVRARPLMTTEAEKRRPRVVSAGGGSSLKDRDSGTPRGLLFRGGRWRPLAGGKSWQVGTPSPGLAGRDLEGF